MKEAVVILGLLDMEPRACESVIGVDRGALYAAKRGIHMELAIGDFDSVNEEEKTFLMEYADQVITLPKIKDDTDTEAALRYLEGKYDFLHVYGGLGGRLDHEFANLYLLLRQSNDMALYNPTNKIYVLKKGTHDIKKEGYQYISFFALCDTVVTMRGSKYEVTDASLKPYDIYGVSNEIVEDSMTITSDQALLVFQSNDTKR